MLVRQLMQSKVFTVPPEKDFNHVEVVAELKNIRHIPVVDEQNSVVGVLSIRDLLAHLSVAGASHFVPVRELMQRNVVTTSPSTPAKEAARIMIENEIGCLPVVEDGKLAGIVTERDFLRHAAEAL